MHQCHPQELQPLIIGSLSQLIRTLSLQAVLLELTKTVVGLDSTGLAAAAHQVGKPDGEGALVLDACDILLIEGEAIAMLER